MKKRLNEIIKKEDGAALVLAMMVLLVLSALGASLGLVTVGSYRLADNTHDSSSAYYIAEAGANMAYAELEKEVNNVYIRVESAETFFKEINEIDIVKTGKKYKNFSSEFGPQPEADVTINQNPEGENGKYTIHSTGNIDGKERVVEKIVSINWVLKPESGPSVDIPSGAALIAKSGIEIDQNSNPEIKGDMHLEVLKPSEPGIKITENNFEFNKNVYLHPDFNLDNINTITSGPGAKALDFYNRDKALPWESYEKLVDFNQHNEMFNRNIGIEEGEIKFESENSIFELDEDLSIEKLYFRNDTLIDTKGKEINIVVDSIYFEWGGFSVTLAEGSKLNIYVRDNFKFNGGGIEVNPDGAHQNLKIFYKGKAPFETGDNSVSLKASVHVNKAKVNVQNFDGIIITGGKEVDINNSSSLNGMVVAPHAKTTIQSTVKFDGQLVSDTFLFKNSGDTTIEYSDDKMGNFPFGDSAPTEGIEYSDGNVDLIKPQPAIEP